MLSNYSYYEGILRLSDFAYIICIKHSSSSSYLFIIIIFTNPSARAGYDTRSIFTRSLSGERGSGISMPLAWISLTLSRHFSLSFITSSRSSGLHPVSSQSCCMYVQVCRPAFARPYAGVHRSTSLMSSSQFYSRVLHVWFV